MKKQDLTDPNVRELLYAKTRLLSKLHSDESRKKYIETIEKELEALAASLKKKHKDMVNLSKFVTERIIDKIIDLLEMEIVLSPKYMDELIGFLRNDDYCDRLVRAARAFQNAGMDELYSEFANKAIEVGMEARWRLGWFAEIWVGDDAKELGLNEEAEELYKEAIIGMTNDLRSDGTIVLGDESYDGLERVVEIAEELGLTAEKTTLLKAALEAYQKDDENDSNAYEIAGVYELMGKKKLSSEMYKRAMKKAELDGNMRLAASIASDAGLSNLAEIYTELAEIQFLIRN